MDYRFLKNLTPNVGYLFPRNLITLSSTPAKDIVSPGVGQIFRSPSIYVPVFGLKSTHLIQKVSQNGGSNEINSNQAKENEITKKTALNAEINKPITKRKFTEGIEESFQHPLIKTDTLILPKKSKKDNSFKFQVVD